MDVTIRQQAAQIAEQKEKYETIEVELKNQMKYNKQILQKCEDLADSERMTKFKLKQTDTQMAQLRKKFDTSESAVRGQMKKIRELELQLADSKAKADTVEKARDKAILNGRKLRSEKEQMRHTIENYEKKSSEHELARIKSKFKKHGVTDEDLEVSESSEISVSSKAIKIEIKLLRKSLKKLDHELSQYKKEHGELTEENENLRSKLKETNRSLVAKDRAVDETNSDNEKIRRSLNISQERIRLLQEKVDQLQEEVRQNEINETVHEKLKSTEVRLKNVMKDNSTLKQRVIDVTEKMNKESSSESTSKAELTRLNKDISRKRALIDDLQQKLKEKEKQLLELGDQVHMNKDDFESKSSQLSQSRRTNDNLRRQVHELKLEKDAQGMELNSIRSRMAKLESEKAKVDLELNDAEGEVARLSNKFEGSLKHSEVRQRQAIDLLENKMCEIRTSRDEMTQTLKNIMRKYNHRPNHPTVQLIQKLFRRSSRKRTTLSR